MSSMRTGKGVLALVVAGMFLSFSVNHVFAQTQAGSKKEEKKLKKETKKLEGKAEEAEEALGRDAVFCILAAHTSGVGTAQQLRDKFNSLSGFPFGQFVAAVLLADRIAKPLDEILAQLQAGMSIGQITKEADVSMGEVRRGFGEFRSELARSMTNPPTRDCFASTP